MCSKVRARMAGATAVACQHVRRTATQSSIRHDDGFVPRRCTLEGFAQEVALTEGVGLAELESLTTLLVRTDNSLYRITVLQPPQPKILVQGGRFFPETTEGRLAGSSFGGSFLKMAWLGCGLRMEIYSKGQRIVTSPVRSIEIQQDSCLPGPF